MIKKETLLEYRRLSRKFGHRPTAETERMLIQAGLELLEEVERLKAPRCDWDCDGCRGDDEDEERSGGYHDPPHGFLTLPPNGEEM